MWCPRSRDCVLLGIYAVITSSSVSFFVLPALLAKGRYQIRVGWLEPVGGSVLPIVSSTVTYRSR
jgi:hypothetical protein